jgi:hypothetical protein
MVRQEPEFYHNCREPAVMLIEISRQNIHSSCGIDESAHGINLGWLHGFAGHRLSISSMSSSAQLIASAIALIVAGTRFPPSYSELE